MANGGVSSLSILNVYGYTPFTLTAALGNTELFMHFISKYGALCFASHGHWRLRVCPIVLF